MKKIIILSGDPNSINSEIIFKSWKKISKSLKKRIYLISNYKLIKNQFKKLGYSIKVQQVKNIDESSKNDSLKIINIDLIYKNPFKVSLSSNQKFVIKCLNLGHKLSLNKNISGIINCPINKNLLSKTKTGVTEFFASKCRVKNNSEVMLIWNRKLAVSPVTTHLDVKDISKKLNKQLITKKIINIDLWFKKKFKKKPKIAVLGLNPHNAEFRKNSEERRIIIPAIKKLKNLKIKVFGPFVADTLFINDFKNYNVIVGMFHDQVLAPFKSIFKFNAVNITLGLKYLRVSPDHGVAVDLVGKNKADETSLLQCIDVIKKFGK
jgi:4-hydroxythreonine-4-phosphate dehydrogenase